MNIYLKHLLEAFYNVKTSFYSSYAFRGNISLPNFDNEELEKYEQYVERVFTYELYFQFRTIMENNSRYYKDLVLNSEITKLNFSKTLVGKHKIFPDMVLHKSQTNRSENYQTLFIEIKVRPNASLTDDIKKLYMAVGDRLNFQYGIMICINYDDRTPEKLIRKSVKNIFTTEEDILKMETLNKKLYLLTEEGFKNFTRII